LRGIKSSHVLDSTPEKGWRRRGWGTKLGPYREEKLPEGGRRGWGLDGEIGDHYFSGGRGDGVTAQIGGMG